MLTGGLATGGQFRWVQMKIQDLSLFVLPGSCLPSAMIVLYLRWCGDSASSYGWYGLPLAATALCLAYLNFLVRQSRRGQ
ncbi:hypothetical protein ASD82_12605 [Rhodanobacter sp. Root179]|nr:hypothetical protein ASD82_12605 [Rhodanobacter sp. Root179]